MTRSKAPIALEASEITKARQELDRQVYELRLELAGLRRARDSMKDNANMYREGAWMLLVMVGRYQRALKSLGWSPPDDELALTEKIRKDLEK